jgi:RNA polymerase sigma-70 factor, ECF subfamily
VNTHEDLLERARQIDLDALAEIYDTFSPPIFRYAFRLTGSEDQAEECVAEVFSRFLNALHAGGGPHQHLKAYLYRVAHNWITDQYRRQPPPPLPFEAELLGSSDHDTAENAVDNMDQAQVRAVLQLLTPDQRQVIVLKYYEGFTNEEAAEALHKPVGAVKSLQHRALDALRRMLLSEGNINEQN